MKTLLSTCNDRVNVLNIPASERPSKRYEYWVTGFGEFPLDMLRYDSCWPATGSDVSGLNRPEIDPFKPTRKPRSVLLRSYNAPTIERWSSFQWSVGKRAVVRE